MLLPFQAFAQRRPCFLSRQIRYTTTKILMAVLAVLAVSLTINHLRACIDHIWAIKTANTANTAMHIFIYLLHYCSANPSPRAYSVVPWLLGACLK